METGESGVYPEDKKDELLLDQGFRTDVISPEDIEEIGERVCERCSSSMHPLHHSQHAYRTSYSTEMLST